MSCNAKPVKRPPYCRERRPTLFTGESRTQQSHADSVDVNSIIGRFDRTGVLPQATRVPQYADVTELQGDLTERLDTARDVIERTESYLSTKKSVPQEKDRLPDPPKEESPPPPPLS